MKLQIKELEANVLAAAPDKAKQKQLEKSLEAFKKGRLIVKYVHTFILSILCYSVLPS